MKPNPLSIGLTSKNHIVRCYLVNGVRYYHIISKTLEVNVAEYKCHFDGHATMATDRDLELLMFRPDFYFEHRKKFKKIILCFIFNAWVAKKEKENHKMLAR